MNKKEETPDYSGVWFVQFLFIMGKLLGANIGWGWVFMPTYFILVLCALITITEIQKYKESK